MIRQPAYHFWKFLMKNMIPTNSGLMMYVCMYVCTYIHTYIHTYMRACIAYNWVRKTGIAKLHGCILLIQLVAMEIAIRIYT